MTREQQTINEMVELLIEIRKIQAIGVVRFRIDDYFRKNGIPIPTLPDREAFVENKGYLCLAPGCEIEANTRGYCKLHYMRLWRYGTTEKVPRVKKPRNPCSVPDCDRPAQARGLCHAHYNIWWRNRAAKKRPKR